MEMNKILIYLHQVLIVFDSIFFKGWIKNFQSTQTNVTKSGCAFGILLFYSFFTESNELAGKTI